MTNAPPSLIEASGRSYNFQYIIPAGFIVKPASFLLPVIRARLWRHLHSCFPKKQNPDFCG